MIRGNAHIYQGSVGTGRAIQDIRKANANLLDGVARAVGKMIGRLYGDAHIDRNVGLLHWIRVVPEETQEIVWLDPYGIDYHITTSTNLEWTII